MYVKGLSFATSDMAVCWHFHGNIKVVQLGLKTGSTGMDMQYAPKKGDTKFANASRILRTYMYCAHISCGSCVIHVLSRSTRVVPQP